MSQNTQNTNDALQNVAVSAISAASKTPFKTAFKITVAIGLAHLALLCAGAAIVVVFYKVLSN